MHMLGHVLHSAIDTVSSVVIKGGYWLVYMLCLVLHDVRSYLLSVIQVVDNAVRCEGVELPRC